MGANIVVTKICILGNCQAQHLESMLAIACPDVEVLKIEPVFMMTAEHHATLYDTLGKADFIFAQRISDEFKLDWLASTTVKATFGSKVTVWPNVYFDGYFPGVTYIYLGGWGKLLSPLVEYHFDQVAKAYKTGKSVDEAIQSYAGDSLFATSPDPFDQSLQQLRSREAEADIKISDIIEQKSASNRFFYTPNHPTNELLGELLRRLTAHVGLDGNIAEAVAMPYRLDDVYIAASPAVVRRYGLEFDEDSRYRGREIASIDGQRITFGEVCDYDPRSLTESFYRLYDVVFAKAS